MTEETATKDTPPADKPASNGTGDYVLPVAHTHVPKRVVDVAFWGGLAGAVVFGVVDPPLGVLLGGAVVVARHRSSRDR